jgi:hypothetical protein
VSASWLACTLNLDRWSPKWTPFLYAIFGSFLCNHFVSPLWTRPTDARGRDSPFRHARSVITTRAFPLLLPPSPASHRHLPHHHRKRNATAENYSLEPNLTVIREGSEDTYLHAVLPISISQAEQIRLALLPAREAEMCPSAVHRFA